jgi:hypothetical protein
MNDPQTDLVPEVPSWKKFVLGLLLAALLVGVAYGVLAWCALSTAAIYQESYPLAL